MLVTRIEALTKQKYQIELDGQLAFVLYRGELSRYRIREGRELEEETYREIVNVVLVKRAKLRAMHLLQKMDRTEKDLRDKLTRSRYPDNAVDTAIEYVKSYGYIDDRQYARRYIEYAKNTKGKQRLLSELWQKGISREIVSEVLEESELGDQRELIRNLIRKKYKDIVGVDEKEVKRIYGFLARKGFQSSEIWGVLEEERKTGPDCPYSNL